MRVLENKGKYSTQRINKAKPTLVVSVTIDTGEEGIHAPKVMLHDFCSSHLEPSHSHKSHCLYQLVCLFASGVCEVGGQLSIPNCNSKLSTST